MKERRKDRVSIPLRLIDGNLEILLEGKLACNSIEFKRDPETANGVLMLLGFTAEQQLEADKLGFQSRKMEE